MIGGINNMRNHEGEAASVKLLAYNASLSQPTLIAHYIALALARHHLLRIRPSCRRWRWRFRNSIVTTISSAGLRFMPTERRKYWKLYSWKYIRDSSFWKGLLIQSTSAVLHHSMAAGRTKASADEINRIYWRDICWCQGKHYQNNLSKIN